ncbi:hypothetical protein BH10PSE7_BH10PSE7_21900 [soil metagenome]
MRKLVLAAFVALGLAVPGSAAQAGGIKIGILSCGIGSGIGWIIASSKSVDCVYQPGHGGRIEHYQGRIGKLGVDIGVTNQSVLVWAVFAPGRTHHGGLEGVYGGATAEATVAVGFGANVLVGGFENTINLQPVSVQAQTGINFAAGRAGLRRNQGENDLGTK